MAVAVLIALFLGPPVALEVWAVRVSRGPEAPRAIYAMKYAIPAVFVLAFLIGSVRAVQTVSALDRPHDAAVFSAGISEFLNNLGFLFLGLDVALILILGGWTVWKRLR